MFRTARGQLAAEQRSVGPSLVHVVLCGAGLSNEESLEEVHACTDQR